MPQFTRQSSRPLTAASYAAAVRRQRQLLDTIERYAGASQPRERAQLTRAIHGLSLGAQSLSRRHAGKSDTSSGRVAKWRARQRAAGLVKTEAWVPKTQE